MLWRSKIAPKISQASFVSAANGKGLVIAGGSLGLVKRWLRS